MRTSQLIYIVIVAVFVFSACTENPDSAGEQKPEASATLNSLTEAVKSGAENVGESVSEAATETVEVVGEGATQAGQAVSDAATDATAAVKEGAVKVEQGVSDAGAVIESNMDSIKGNVDPASVPAMEAGDAAPATPDSAVEVVESVEVGEVPVPDATAVGTEAVAEQVEVETAVPAPQDAAEKAAEAAGSAAPEVPSVPDAPAVPQ